MWSKASENVSKRNAENVKCNFPNIHSFEFEFSWDLNITGLKHKCHKGDLSTTNLVH